MDRLHRLSRDLLKRHFLKGKGRCTGFTRAREELRGQVTFRRFNLLDEIWPEEERFDMIFCRNAMIYFDKLTQLTLLKKLARSLARRASVRGAL